jgi:hypothetical protein
MANLGRRISASGRNEFGLQWPNIRGMREPSAIRSYKLVPSQATGSEPGPGVPGVRRYRLARVGVNWRSALGQDRHERLERIAGIGAEPPRRP